MNVIAIIDVVIAVLCVIGLMSSIVTLHYLGMNHSEIRKLYKEALSVQFSTWKLSFFNILSNTVFIAGVVYFDAWISFTTSIVMLAALAIYTFWPDSSKKIVA
jgi:hypothetical protein